MVIEYVLSRLLTELVDLEGTKKSAEICTIAGRAQNATRTKTNPCIGKDEACDFLVSKMCTYIVVSNVEFLGHPDSGVATARVTAEEERGGEVTMSRPPAALMQWQS